MITIRPERVNQLLGTQLAVDEMIQCLESLGCRVEATESSEAGLSVAVPHHRRDIEREVDLIEEVGRIYGFDNISYVAAGNGYLQWGKPRVAAGGQGAQRMRGGRLA